MITNTNTTPAFGLQHKISSSLVTHMGLQVGVSDKDQTLLKG